MFDSILQDKEIPRVAVYVCHCGINIAATVNVLKVAEYAKTLPHVVVAGTYKFMCSDPGQEIIQKDIREYKVNRVVVAAVNRVVRHKSLETRKVPVTPAVLVVGGGISGIHAALTLANSGKQVYLVEKEPTIGGHMAQFDKTFPTLDCAACILTPKMSAVRAHPNITMWTYSEVVGIDGYVGNFTARVKRKPRYVNEDLCVGSRDKNFNAYCSRVCCMYSLKLAHIIKERTNAEVYNFYIDMRTPGKGYEEFYDKLLQEDVNFIRGRVAEVTNWAQVEEEEGKLVIRVEDTNIGVVRRISVDMVVLAVGLEPQDDVEEMSRLLKLQCSRDGWYLERHPKLAPVSTFSEGIFLAGACQGPKDIPDSVAQAGAAASEALVLIDKGYVDLEPYTAFIREELCSGCRICVPLCPYDAIAINPETGVAEVNQTQCKGCGTCVAACPCGAAQQYQFSNEQIYAEIEGIMEGL